MAKLLDQLRNNMEREALSSLGPKADTDVRKGMDIDINYRGTTGPMVSSSTGASYHQAVKEKKGYYFDKNMVLQRGLTQKVVWENLSVPEEEAK